MAGASSRTIIATLAFKGATVSVVRQDTLTIEGGRVDADPRTNRMLVLREPEDRRIVVAPNWLAGVRLMLRAK